MPAPLRRRTMLARAALLACLFAVLPAAGASAAPVPGLNLGGAVSVPELDAGLSTGARSVRLFAPWDALQPAGPGSWNAGLLAQYEADVAHLGQVGAKAVIVLTGAPGWAGGSSVAPPSDPQAFAAFAGAFASKLRVAAGRPGVVIGYEVWNEADAGEFWAGAPDAARYAALLKATAPRLRAADPAAKVVLGPTTGNNYGWLAQLYGHGVQGSFDAVAVHTDTACLDRGPDQYYRDNGRLGQFTFLGYREVHATMAAHGDADKPIWMTELGWSATSLLCARGSWAGQKPAGVSEAQQAAYLEQAFHCMAADPYVEQAMWFSHRDAGVAESELNRYGLVRADGSRRPAWDAFRAVATQGDRLTAACGDFGGPSVRILQPATGMKYVDYLPIAVSGSDPAGILDLTVKGDGKNLRHFRAASGLVNDKVMSMTWYGAKALSYGPHTITVVGKDPSGNTTTASVKVVHVRPGQLAKSLRTSVTTRLARTGMVATLSGRVAGSGPLRLGGRARVVWEWKSPKGWRKLHGALRNAARPFVFRQRLARRGTWRVQVRYQARAPYRASASAWRTFVVK